MLDDWESVKRRVEQMQRDHDRGVGALEQAKARMKELLGTSNLKEAEKKLAAMEEDERETARKWTSALNKFKKAVEGKIESEE